MRETFIRRVRKSGGSNCVNIPVEILKLLDLNEGDLVKVVVEKINEEVNEDE